MTSKTLHVGWIGIGKMGKPMSRRVLKSGMPVTVYEPLAQNRASVVAEGADMAISLPDLAAAADVVALTIPNDAVLESLAFGPDGLVQSMRPGQILLEMSTVSPAISRRLAESFAQRDVSYLRAPVSGSTATAVSGQLSVMVSGPKAAFQKVLPLLEAFSTRQFHIGLEEEARYLKLVLNALVGATSALLGEALTLGRSGGLSDETMLEVIGQSAVASPLIAYKKDLLISRNFEPAFTVEQMMKDFDLILGAARSDHVPMTLAALVRQQYEAAFATGHAQDDFFVLVELCERLAGLPADKGAGVPLDRAAGDR
ncbi:NAD(P)-dependent oxidoreductase [Aureimonas phyllosphaerae]|uniref:3-hydroxyisobutyrate dehydrogenase n=1 Tax=Aureimonas phyllosphaerae TaxID=1166078 RepID=A0A7W6BZ10_9HYPH|nr:NAD(P)-dependent oxidoreductase [Aureimonas phyllosphaerae]MBB3937783.1 3-hydroxyisobutyrate dehydrogenase [Aureimonas phyllosphaerae]MBB3961682.1 3-hydroxyisobutyrate dehydrogenase [Aureimonas phyllosphaerae]SFF45903.1 3-hydroxyisobutyrate dehydrogenase [Aureimonas phyllosphaerae]